MHDKSSHVGKLWSIFFRSYNINTIEPKELLKKKIATLSAHNTPFFYVDFSRMGMYILSPSKKNQNKCEKDSSWCTFFWR